MENLMEGYPVVIEVPVAWGEMDSFGHLNNIYYFRYFESSRVAYFYKLDAIGLTTSTGIGPILASTSCKFKVPLKYPDKVLVGAKVTNIEEDRFTMTHAIASMNHNRIAAEGYCLIVSFDYKENRKAPLPTEMKERILALEGRR